MNIKTSPHFLAHRPRSFRLLALKTGLEKNGVPAFRFVNIRMLKTRHAAQMSINPPNQQNHHVIKSHCHVIRSLGVIILKLR